LHQILSVTFEQIKIPVKLSHPLQISGITGADEQFNDCVTPTSKVYQ